MTQSKSVYRVIAISIFMTLWLHACGQSGNDVDTDDASLNHSPSSDTVGTEEPCSECGENQNCINDVCVCHEGFANCDNNFENGCETAGDCVCPPGEQRSCYYGPIGTESVGVCTSGTETCNGFNWGECEGLVMPSFESCEPDGLDNDCDGSVDEDDDADVDGDGFSICDGDCCDNPNQNCAGTPSLVNPGAFDYIGNQVDDDCDGTVDNPLPTDCSQEPMTSQVQASDLAHAMELCQFVDNDTRRWGVLSTHLTDSSGTGLPQSFQTGVLEGLGLGTVAPMKNTTLAVLSSGDARGVGDPGYTSSHSDGDWELDAGPNEYLAIHGQELQTSESCPFTDANLYNTVRLRIEVRVPTNAQGFRFQFRFWTHEYPIYLCTPFNDFFLALLTSAHPNIPYDKNISFDAAGNPVSVNNAFFTTCDALACYGEHYSTQLAFAPDADSDGCVDSLSCNTQTQECETNLGACPDGFSDVLAFSANPENAGATSWLTTTAPVVPGEVITLEFHIWDTGDSSYDSLVVLDNFDWLIEPTEVVTKR